MHHLSLYKDYLEKQMPLNWSIVILFSKNMLCPLAVLQSILSIEQEETLVQRKRIKTYYFQIIDVL